MGFRLEDLDEPYVGDLALALGAAQAPSSYAENAAHCRARRFHKNGGAVYTLAEGFPHLLLEHCLRQLTSCSRPGAALPERIR